MDIQGVGKGDTFPMETAVPSGGSSLTKVKQEIEAQVETVTVTSNTINGETCISIKNTTMQWLLEMVVQNQRSIRLCITT